ncbi:hypothetical protein GMA11_01470 [Granulicatella sp. zg-ZJ]|uniref:hypothetical protein n=1 Tax=unclassified Granulicatella TaxID=2630493 RepID=UPI0013C13D24|nr:MULTISPECIES: hypothetical protein [unclassified Granulicatella]MBS4749949.1 hypothetical protein [Carnobacteriaceae bacterium zg-ZUI78]NEW62054.1 hypothetical protein [Granulicatella sp. zg-ZJ]NEW66148.1 hypothetical protein [Granulicatella sp. zg-84]QMI86094.1 hypothetical protein H1220_01600 [Carnobacteriaceae bacterium zg-84]
MATKKKKAIIKSEPLELVDGYYIPVEIVDSYKRLRAYCVSELLDVFRTFCHSVECMYEDGLMVVSAIDNQTNVAYRVDITPQTVSQIEKAIGTKKIQNYIEQLKENGVWIR